MSQLLPEPFFDHVTVARFIDVVSHFLLIWGGVALFLLIGLRWIPRHRQATQRQWFIFIATMLLLVYAWFTAMFLLPVSAYGRYTSVGLPASLRLALLPLGYVVGVIVLPQIVMSAGMKALEYVRSRRQQHSA